MSSWKKQLDKMGLRKYNSRRHGDAERKQRRARTPRDTVRGRGGQVALRDIVNPCRHPKCQFAMDQGQTVETMAAFDGARDLGGAVQVCSTASLCPNPISHPTPPGLKCHSGERPRKSEIRRQTTQESSLAVNDLGRGDQCYMPSDQDRELDYE